MIRRAAAGAAMLVVLAGCAFDRNGAELTGAGGGGAGAGGPGGGGQGGSGAMGGMGGQGGGTTPECGDGMVNQASEMCDEGPQNTANCDNDCTTPECGDGLLNTLSGENCDEGGQNTATCDSDCTVPTCGDGLFNQAAGEECDGGGQNTAMCDSDCTTPVCGDGVHNVQAGEGCDDGNTMDGDGCNSLCVSEMCGNSVQDAGEQCDDGNMVNNDDCLNNCNLPTCGDGVVHDQQSGSEVCDDGNGVNEDACPDGANGTCLPASCGDSFVYTGMEACDDGNASNNDDCLNSCDLPSCGDGFVYNQGNGTEPCDDGNASNNDDCLVGCVAASCGDGFINTMGTNTEACDDGQAVANGDGCDVTCARESGWCCDGEPSACAQGPFTISATMLGLAIPDDGVMNMNYACHQLSFTQAGCGAVTGLEVTVGINHGYVGDLLIGMFNPDPNTNFAFFMDRPGVPATMFGDSSNLAATAPITFVDGAATSAEAMGAGISNSEVVCQDGPMICVYDPSPDALSSLYLADPTGSWTVCVGDDDATATGTFESVEVLVSTQ